jgi:Homeodomain-like domain-containing protein
MKGGRTVDTVVIVRALLGVGYYRSSAAPDLALYLGDACYPGFKTIWVRLGINDRTGRPYIDHSHGPFDEDSIEIKISQSMKGKDTTREAHMRKSRILRDSWRNLACPARGFAKSPVHSEDKGAFVRSSIDNWRVEPGKGKRLVIPEFRHSTLSHAIAEGEHQLHTLSHEDRQAIVVHFAQYGLDPVQIAAVLGCSAKTIYTWHRAREPKVASGAPTRDDLLGVISRLQDLVGVARREHMNDIAPDRDTRVSTPLIEAEQLCIAARSLDPPEAGSNSAFMEKWKSKPETD